VTRPGEDVKSQLIDFIGVAPYDSHHAESIVPRTAPPPKDRRGSGLPVLEEDPLVHVAHAAYRLDGEPPFAGHLSNCQDLWMGAAPTQR